MTRRLPSRKSAFVVGLLLVFASNQLTPIVRCGRVCYSRSSLALQCSSHHLPASFKEEARVKAQLSQRFDLILKLARLIVCSRNQHVHSHSSANIMSSMGARAILGHLPLNLPYLQPTNAILVIRTEYGVLISRPPKRATEEEGPSRNLALCSSPRRGISPNAHHHKYMRAYCDTPHFICTVAGNACGVVWHGAANVHTCSVPHTRACWQ